MANVNCGPAKQRLADANYTRPKDRGGCFTCSHSQNITWDTGLIKCTKHKALVHKLGLCGAHTQNESVEPADEMRVWYAITEQMINGQVIPA